MLNLSSVLLSQNVMKVELYVMHSCSTTQCTLHLKFSSSMYPAHELDPPLPIIIQSLRRGPLFLQKAYSAEGWLQAGEKQGQGARLSPGGDFDGHEGVSANLENMIVISWRSPTCDIQLT